MGDKMSREQKIIKSSIEHIKTAFEYLQMAEYTDKAPILLGLLEAQANLEQLSKQKYTVKIPLSEMDLEDLLAGQAFNSIGFNWNFPTEEDQNVVINCKLYLDNNEME
jgi:hypothetical protein